MFSCYSFYAISKETSEDVDKKRCQDRPGRGVYESYVNNHSLSFSFTGYKEQNDEGTAYKRDVN